MKVAQQLGLFVALALLATGCGTKAVITPEQSEQEQADVQTVADPEKEAEPNVQEQTDAETEKKDAEGQTAEQPAKQDAPKQQAGTQPSTQPGTQSGKSNTTATAPAKQGTASSGTTNPATPAPAPQPAPKPEKVKDGTLHLMITENFGRQSVLKQTVAFNSGETLMDVLMNNTEVETSYGGSFVNGINGTSSGYTGKSMFTREKRDWFFYQNGSIGAVGADSLKVNTGDDIWWDYHDWSGSGNNTSAVIGAYPHPFTTGYGGATPGTVIYYTGSHADDAGRLAAGLKALGAGKVQTASYDDAKAANPSTNAIVLGTWAEAGNQPAVQTAFSSPTKTGVYASYGEGAFRVLNHEGDEAGGTGKGLIVATGQGSGDTTPLWLVLGTTEEALDSAIDLMVSSPQQLKGKVGLVLNGREATSVPVGE